MEGSVSQAAKKLLLGQPAISLQLKQLEDNLGLQLFHRENRKLTLTEAGQTALEYANQIFRLGDEMQEALKNGSFARRAHLQVGALDSIPKKLIQLLIQAAGEVAECSITVLEGEGDFLFRELLAYKTDLVISNYPPSIGNAKLHSSRMLASAPISIFAAPKFKNLARKFPQSMAGQPFIFPTLHSKLRRDLEHYFRVREIPINIAIETQDTAVQKRLGMEGLGLVPLADFSVKGIRKRGQLVKLGTLAELHEEYWLTSNSGLIHNPVAASLFENFQLKI